MRSFLRSAWLIASLAMALAVPTRAQQPAPVNRPVSQPVTHVVQEGETLWSIAQRYGLTVPVLRRLNDLESNLIQAGRKLIVSRPDDGDDNTQRAAAPDASSPSELSSSEASSPAAAATAAGAPLSDREYVVQRGETLFSIAERYGLSADTLWRLNDRPTAPLDSGRVLHLPATIRGTHRVRDGESLSLLARRYGVTLQALRRANPDVRGSTIYTGQVLQLPSVVQKGAAQAASDTTFSGAVQSYPNAFAGRLTASGAPYDPDDFTVSHGTLPLGTVVLLKNPTNDRSTFAVVNDRGPLSPDYLLEASNAVLRKLRLSPGSEQPVELRVVEQPRSR